MAMEEDLLPLTPVNFFQLRLSCGYLLPKGPFPRLNQKNKSDFLLPETSPLCHEEHFADAAMGWNEEGIELFFEVDKAFDVSYYPEIIRGDSVEVFIDTRDVKNSGYNTRFCHHFFFFPEAIEGRQAGELTHFRTDDAHEWCNPDDLKVKSDLKHKSYILHCFIPKACMTGYDPDQFNRIGFTYRINRPRYESQHFSVVTTDYKLEQQPSLWSTVRLEK